MKYKVGQVYDFRYANAPVLENEQYRPGTIVTITSDGNPVGKYNVIWSTDTIIRGLVFEMIGEELEYETDHRVFITLPVDAIETLKNKGSVSYEIIFNLAEDCVVYDTFGPYLIPGENNGT